MGSGIVPTPPNGCSRALASGNQPGAGAWPFSFGRGRVKGPRASWLVGWLAGQPCAREAAATVGLNVKNIATGAGGGRGRGRRRGARFLRTALCDVMCHFSAYEPLCLGDRLAAWCQSVLCTCTCTYTPGAECLCRPGYVGVGCDLFRDGCPYGVHGVCTSNPRQVWGTC